MNDKQWEYLYDNLPDWLTNRNEWDSIYTALQRLAWRPISEAPRDGTDMLFMDEGIVKMGFFDWCPCDREYYPSNKDAQVLNPTHFMPLPPTPKEGE